jgi:hypothetical protein
MLQPKDLPKLEMGYTLRAPNGELWWVSRGSDGYNVLEAVTVVTERDLDGLDLLTFAAIIAPMELVCPAWRDEEQLHNQEGVGDDWT